MKKILFVNSRLSSGGSEKVMSLLANYFSKHNYEVSMILLRDPLETSYDIEKNIKIIQFKNRKSNKISIFIKRCLQLRKTIKEIQPDIIISFMVDINFCTILSTPAKMRNRVILSERADPEAKNRTIFHKILEKTLYPKAKFIVTQTNLVQQYFRKHSIQNVVTIANPIEIDAQRTLWNPNNHPNKVIAVGRLTEQKNFGLLIDAFNEFHKKHTDYTLEIYGDGPMQSNLNMLIKNFDLSKFIKIKKFTKNLKDKMINSSFYVSSSNFEGISNAMLEAISLGLPTICTDCRVGGARMVIDNMKNGILTKVGDKNQLVKAMDAVASNSQLQISLSQQAIRSVDQFSTDKVAAKWEKLFLNIITGKSL